MAQVIYYGNSMYRVFTPGERLELAEADFKDLQAGDIVVVENSGKNTYVHRVVEKNHEFAVTMGDNNPAVDEYKLTRESDFLLVVAALTPQGKKRQINGGKQGLREFYRHRRQRAWRMQVGRIARWAERLFFWRITLHEQKKFGQEVCFYRNGRAIARRTADGRVAYMNWRDRIIFRLPEDV